MADGGDRPNLGGVAAGGPPVWPATGRYLEYWRRSLDDPERFWESVAREAVRWIRPFRRTLEWQPPYARWFADGTLNACDTCLDRHLDGEVRNRVAYYWEGEDGARRTLSFADLAREVHRMAAAIHEAGFSSADRAALYLPMVPELPIVMLALARLGIPFTTVFSGFSAAALADRLQRLGVRLLFTADGGYRRGKVVPLKAIADEALGRCPSVRQVVVLRRTGENVAMSAGRDVGWSEFVRDAPATVPAVEVPSTHPLYYLYSSGTTGSPKAVVHGTGGYLVHVAASMRWVFDPGPNDVFWCAADIGWVTGHSYIVFGPLATATTGLLYEGAFDHPAPDRLWELVERYRVSILYTSPTALRGLRRYGDANVTRHDLSSLRLLGSVGEAINPTVWQWYFEVVGGGRCPVVDTWWQTETGGILISPAPGVSLVPLKPGSATLPLPGIDAEVVGEDGRPALPGVKGYAVIRRPWPGMLLTLHEDDERFRSVYWARFPGSYYPGDYAVRDAEGYFWFLGRADEVLKVAGHRLGTIEIEGALLTHPVAAEAAVCARVDPVKGEVPVAFVVLRRPARPSAELGEELADRVGQEIGRIARPGEVHFVSMLPKTRSGKIMRRVVRAVAEDRPELGDLSTLEEGASIEEIRAALRAFRAAVDAAGAPVLPGPEAP